MRREIIVGLGVGTLFILFIFTLPFKFQWNSHEIFRNNKDNHPIESSVYSSTRNIFTDSVSIAATDLPLNIQRVIQTDSLINDLEIRTVTKISHNDDDFYDVCFKDADYFNIMVLYDENGIIVSQ
ncbi:hypothetical protein Q4534_21850 [Cyclobacterium sp. 1_MG-2023]|uniref:hypothetical protein n=1 Tax=Cyclobacterium sp. 1_MG-2023 TaxID=3062681 RepID=UPI0026E352C5|nr:hypothetical protein [Cyclobacterium sp. 1_MG-2023]MDO6440087.1 hypothetical protein [Cyclobacterium sp. 1_MG-2023]